MKHSRRFRGNSRKRNSRARSRRYNKRSKIIKGGGISWNGFSLISNNDGEYNPAVLATTLEGYPGGDLNCDFIPTIVADLRKTPNSPNANLIFYGPGRTYICGFVQYISHEDDKLIQIPYLCCWFRILVNAGIETYLKGGYSAGQVMMAMTISYLSIKYTGYTIYLISSPNAVNYYISCGFNSDPGNKQVMRYLITSSLDTDSVISGFVPNRRGS
jgi:hypothetical protein